MVPRSYLCVLDFLLHHWRFMVFPQTSYLHLWHLWTYVQSNALLRAQTSGTLDRRSLKDWRLRGTHCTSNKRYWHLGDGHLFLPLPSRLQHPHSPSLLPNSRPSYPSENPEDNIESLQKEGYKEVWDKPRKMLCFFVERNNKQNTFQQKTSMLHGASAVLMPYLLNYFLLYKT